MIIEKNAIMITWLDLFFDTYHFNDDDVDTNNNDDDTIKKTSKKITFKIDYGSFEDLKLIAEKYEVSTDELIIFIYCLYINVYLLNKK